MKIKITYLALPLLLFCGCAMESRTTDVDARTRARLQVEDDTRDANAELTSTIRESHEILSRFMEDESSQVPRELKTQAGCIGVVPNVQKTALLVGSTSGEGVVSCKTAGGQWSAPAFFSLSGMSFGAQLGRQTSDIVLFALGDDATTKFKNAEDIRLGSNVGVQAGPIGAGARIPIRKGVYTYARDTQGLFAGVSLDGSRISMNEDANERYYGSRSVMSDNLNRQRLPEVARQFRDALI